MRLFRDQSSVGDNGRGSATLAANKALAEPSRIYYQLSSEMTPESGLNRDLAKYQLQPFFAREAQ